MTRHRSTLLALLASAAIALAATEPALAHEAAKGTITVLHPWARATAAGATTSPAFMEIRASAAGGDRLIAAQSSVAKRIELHQTVSQSGGAGTTAVKSIAVPAGTSVVLGPRGPALMLLDLAAPLKEGDLVKLSLVFEKAGEISVEATVEAAGATGPHGLDHQPGHAPEQHGGSHKH